MLSRRRFSFPRVGVGIVAPYTEDIGGGKLKEMRGSSPRMTH
jgi:hypothetical protein